MISCLANTTQVAMALSAPLIIPVMLFGGFFLQNGAVPFYFQWLRYMSWFMYGNECLSINQWSGVSFTDPASNCPNKVCTGRDILASFDFNPVSRSPVSYIDTFFADNFYYHIRPGPFLSQCYRIICLGRWIPPHRFLRFA